MKILLLFCLTLLPIFSVPLLSAKSEMMDKLTRVEGFSGKREKALSELKQFSKEFERWNPFSKNNTPIDILIPVIERDLPILAYTVSYARKYILHPIGTIYVVAPPSDKIKAFCAEKGCQFVDESLILPLSLRDIPYHNDRIGDRRGWLYQQFLKLSCDEICEHEHILVLDSDTILVRPQAFRFKKYTLFNCSSESHVPYFTMYERLLQEKPVARFSFVTHHMLFEKAKLRELKQRIEEIHRMHWIEAILSLIDQNEPSGFSEYETYGNFFVSHYPGQFLQLYFFNEEMQRKALFSISNKKNIVKDDYTKSISFHHYLEE
jgi:hypothetical protein